MDLSLKFRNAIGFQDTSGCQSAKDVIYLGGCFLFDFSIIEIPKEIHKLQFKDNSFQNPSHSNGLICHIFAAFRSLLVSATWNTRRFRGHAASVEATQSGREGFLQISSEMTLFFIGKKCKMMQSKYDHCFSVFFYIVVTTV